MLSKRKRQDNESGERVSNSISSDAEILPLEGDENEQASNPFIPERNPMNINLIIHNVLKHCEHKEVKNCRLLNKKWAEIGAWVLGKRSTITLGHPRKPKCFSKFLANFQRDFADSDSTFPISTLQLKWFPGNSSPWTPSALKKVGKEFKDVVTELIFREIRITKDLRSHKFIAEFFDIKKITKLTVIGLDSTYALTFSVEELTHMHHISLRSCRLLLGNTNEKLSPIVLHLVGVVLLYDGEVADCEKKFCHFVEYSKTTDLKIRELTEIMRFSPVSMKMVSLDLHGEATMKKLDLQGIRIGNWSRCCWEVDTLNLKNVIFKGPSQMKVRKLVIENKKRLSMFKLPLSLDILFSSSVLKHFSTLPNLRVLYLVTTKEDGLKYGNDPSSLTAESVDKWKAFCSRYCPSLIKGANPLKKLWLYRNSVVELDDKNLHILVLDQVAPQKALFCVSTLRANLIVWILSRKNKNRFNGKVHDLLRSYKGKIAVGPFDWNRARNINNCKFRKLVSIEAMFYSFENGKGEAISENRFMELLHRE